MNDLQFYLQRLQELKLFQLDDGPETLQRKQ